MKENKEKQIPVLTEKVLTTAGLIERAVWDNVKRMKIDKLIKVKRVNLKNKNITQLRKLHRRKPLIHNEIEQEIQNRINKTANV